MKVVHPLPIQHLPRERQVKIAWTWLALMAVIVLSLLIVCFNT